MAQHVSFKFTPDISPLAATSSSATKVPRMVRVPRTVTMLIVCSHCCVYTSSLRRASEPDSWAQNPFKFYKDTVTFKLK